MNSKFCDECYSLMKDGICTNKKCQKTELEIYNDDINQFLKIYASKKYYSKIINEFNNIYCLDSNFDCSTLENSGALINLLHNVSDIEKLGVNPYIKIITDNEDEGGYEFMQLTMASPKDARGKVKRQYPYYLKLKIIFINKKINATEEIFFGSFNKKTWHITSNIHEFIDESKLLEQLRILIGFKYYLANLWGISIKKSSNIINFKYAIDKKTANKILRLRKKKDGSNRRVTLLHLVNSYTRNKVINQTDVKSHLRGNYEFEIDDLKCKLEPSLKDFMKVKRECIGTDQSNQCTQENIQEDYNIF
ncbi:MAG: hypothetical protein E6094_05595 [Clostridium perfringens]|nr:hypothetical protein [Clostridium perfringens]